VLDINTAALCARVNLSFIIEFRLRPHPDRVRLSGRGGEY
jgi:hypothetical protein